MIKAIKLVNNGGIDFNRKDKKFGNNVLQRSSAWGMIDVVQLLCAQGMDVNAQNKDGHTAIWLASQNKHPEVI